MAEASKPEAAPGPTQLNTSACGPFLEVGSDRLSVKYVGAGAHDHDISAIQADAPAPRAVAASYWEVTVVAGGSGRCSVAVGFTDAGFKKARHPGYDVGTYGYLSESGRLHSGSALRGELYGPAWGTGDTIGVCFLPPRGEVFFTLNGVSLGTAFKTTRRAPLFPTIGLHSPGAHVEVNFGGRPWKYDLEGMLRREREREAAEVARAPLPPGLALQYVTEYLRYHGYQGTLAALRADVGELADRRLTPAEAPATARPITPPPPEDRVEEGGEAAVPMEVDGGGGEAPSAAAPGESDAPEGRARRARKPRGKEAAAAAAASEGNGTAADSTAADSTAAGSSGAGSEADWADEWLGHRARLRAQVMAGDAAAAAAWLSDPAGGRDMARWAEGPGPTLATASRRAHFLLACQHYIELIREGDLGGAVALAQSRLASYRGQSAERDRQLAEVTALIAYPDPAASPLAPLLGRARREEAADAANLAGLWAARREPGPGRDGCFDGEPSQLALALSQLAAVQAARHEAAAGQGEAFRLEGHLPPPPPPPDGPGEGA